MRAAFYDKQGTASEVLTIGELPDPQPGAGEVRFRVVTSGINPSDIKTRTGFGGKAMPFPRIIPHQDGAGIIDSVGPGVSAARIGKRVLAQGGAGAVGNAAILLAQWAGAWVAATVSRDEQAEVARAAGADLVINRHKEGVAEAVRLATDGRGVNRIVDVDISAKIDTAVACLARDGVVSAVFYGVAAN